MALCFFVQKLDSKCLISGHVFGPSIIPHVDYQLVMFLARHLMECQEKKRNNKDETITKFENGRAEYPS